MTAETTQNINTTASTTKDVRQSAYAADRVVWSCSTCHIFFHDQQPQREHMKTPWHVYNLKRKLATLEPISEAVFTAQVRPQHESDEDIDKDQESVVDISYDEASAFRCLFCSRSFEPDDAGLDDNLSHMSLEHGFVVPNKDSVLDLESLLSYLSTVIREWHECLHCGTIRESTPAIQSHMRDKEHCKLNLEREPGLLDFWEATEEQQPRLPSSEMLLLSGPPSHRSTRHDRHRPSDNDPSAVATQSRRPQDPRRQRLARRDELGLQHVSLQQRQALVLATKRSQKEQAIASRASEWSYARKANKQKHDQAHGPLSWAKGGMHNLLPR